MYLFCTSLLDNNKAMDPELRDLLRAVATQPVGRYVPTIKQLFGRDIAS